MAVPAESEGLGVYTPIRMKMQYECCEHHEDGGFLKALAGPCLSTPWENPAQ
jgi:hypothetical protein